MSAYVVTVRSHAGLGALATFVDYPKAAKMPPEKLAVEYVERIAPGGGWYAENVREVGHVGAVREAA